MDLMDKWRYGWIGWWMDGGIDEFGGCLMGGHGWVDGCMDPLDRWVGGWVGG